MEKFTNLKTFNCLIICLTLVLITFFNQEAKSQCTISVPTGILVSASSGSITISVTSNGASSWTASEGCSWVTISPASGTGNGTVTVTYQPNTSGSTRSCNIDFLCGGTGGIYQLSQTAACGVSVPTGTTVAPSAGSTGITVTSNGVSTWTASETCSWVTISPASGTGNGFVTVTYDQNISINPRTCTITFSCDSASSTYTLTQNGESCTVFVTTGTTVNSNSGSTNITVSSNGTASWTASETCSWVTISPDTGTGNGTVVVTYQQNTTGSSRTCIVSFSCSSGFDSYQLTQNAGASCTVSVPLGSTVGENSGTASIPVTSNGISAWTASASCSWASISPTSGTGNGNIMITYQQNTGSQRTCTVTITCGTMTDTYTLTQNAIACTISVPGSANVPANSGSINIPVTSNGVATWTASESCSWVTISPTSGTGNGNVTATYQQNTGSQRSCNISFTCGALEGYLLIQDPDTSACSYSIDPVSYSTTEFGDLFVQITVAAASTCSWTAVSNDSWITIGSGSSGSGIGSVSYDIDVNTGGARVGTITVAGETYTVNQDGASGCTSSISPTSNSIVSGGGTDSISVSIASGCTWTAISNDSWITITSGSSGSGSGTINYSVSNNIGAARTGTITASGETHTVNQDAGPGCSYAIFPASNTVVSSGTTGSISVSTTGGCTWTATSNDSWVTITSGSSGTDSGTVDYSVANNTGAARTGTITAAGETHTVNQDAFAGGCSYTISPTSNTVVASGTTGSISVSTTGGCTWTATSNDSWVTITSGSSGSGSGTVDYSVANNTGAARTGTITAAGEMHTVMQDGFCSGTPPQQPVVTANGCSLAASTVPNVSYQWFLDGNIINGATSQFYTATSGGFYTVLVTDANNCSSTSDPVFGCPVGIEGFSFLNELRIYPNPNTGKFVLKMEITEPESIELKLLNVIGQIIYVKKINEFSGTYEETIDIGQQVAGMYTLQLTSSKETINKKLIIKK